MALCRYKQNDQTQPEPGAWGWIHKETLYPLETEEVIAVCTNPGTEGLARLEKSALERTAVSGFALTTAEISLTSSSPSPTLWERGSGQGCQPRGDKGLSLMAPLLPTQEVWAAGVTYESSKLARMSESEHGSDLYAKVYVADRPELFFKATPRRVIDPEGALHIRADSNWNVPEPELTALISADGQILGYTIGNDMSSRDIEGANALYLPQAKVYRASCGLGPVIVPASQVDPRNLAIHLRIFRQGQNAFEAETNTAQMRRTVQELAGWLMRDNDFPQGVLLLTGTGIVPPDTFSLQSGDRVEIEIEKLGILRHSIA